MGISGQWHLRYYGSILDVPQDILKQPMGDTLIPVPSVWQCHGYDHHQYTNIDYTIPYNPPFVPWEKTCGLYSRVFSGTPTRKRLTNDTKKILPFGSFSLRKFFLFFSVFGYFDILWDCFGPWKQRFYKIICQCLSGHCFKQIFYIFKGDKPVHDCSLCYTVEDDNLIFDEPDSKDFYDGLVELILDTVMSSKKRITIAGNDIPTEVVKSKLLKLDSEHIKYVEHCMDNTTTDIRNIKQYLLSVLYNAPTTMSSYYQAWVNRDNAMAKI